MRNVKIKSDGKDVFIIIERDSIVVKTKNQTMAALPVKEIKSFSIGKRKIKYKPDTFFYSYALLSIIIGTGILYVLFKNDENLNILWIIASFLSITVVALVSMVLAANKKPSLFICYGKGTLEIPIDNEEVIKLLDTFFRSNGLSLFLK
jgi:hypothetical protein